MATLSNRLNHLEILALADRHEDDGLGNNTYTFETPAATISLALSLYDGDVTVEVTVPNQQTPILEVTVVGCEDIVAVDDSRGRFLEIVGQHSVEDFVRGEIRRTAGFRVRLEPSVCVEPFFRKENA